MYSLFIDTHDKSVIIVLYKDGIVLDKKDIFSKNKHSQIALPTIDSILKENNINVHDLGEVLVVNGPGSFTGERLAVTIAKTMSYGLNIPIKSIDSLSLMAISIECNEKIVALEDKNGAFVGYFDNNNKLLKDIEYLPNSVYNGLKEENNIYLEVEVNYNKVYEFMKNIKSDIAHNVKPLYVKGITGLNDK